MPQSPEAAALFQSELYSGKNLTPISHSAEQFIVQTARNLVKENNGIIGVGVMFEPYAFESDIRDYGFYIDTNTVDSSFTPYQSYEDYAKGSFLHDTSAGKTILYFTAIFVWGGGWSYPMERRSCITIRCWVR